MRVVLIALLFSLAAGCGSDEAASGAAGSAAPSGSGDAEEAPKKGKKRKGAKAEPEASASAEPGPPKVEFQETDFGESDRSRDPFRSFAAVFVEQAKSKVKAQVHVVAKQYSVDDLRLVGIVTRIHPPRAMFVDPSGRGHVVDHGDFLGRPEIVQGGTTTTDYEIHWRVDRVREADVVLVREDPANPDVPSATRVCPIRKDDEDTLPMEEE
jgi:type IV pilus assembly protein PilP